MAQLPDPLDSEYRILSKKRFQKVLFGASGSLSLKRLSASERLVRKVRRLISDHSEVWGLAWAEWGRRHPLVRRVPGLVAVILFTGLGQSVLGLIALIYAVAPWFVWALTALSTTVLAEAFVIHYSRIAYERTQAEEVSSRDERIWELLDRLRPNLIIDHDQPRGHPFVDTYYEATEDQVIQYRVTVTSPSSLDDVELVANRVTAGGVTHSNLHLRPMHDRRSEGTKRVRVKAQKPEAWDVISVDKDAVYLNHIEPIGILIFEPGVYEFELMATGGDKPPSTKVAHLEVGERGAIKFGIRDGRLSGS